MRDSNSHEDQMIPRNQESSDAEYFDDRTLIGSIETDRFCDHCGYNLRTQAVRRDPRTELLLCRCPECGRLHSARDEATAGRVWLHRLGTLALFIWIATILGGLFVCGMAQVFVSVGVLEELTTYQQIQTSNLGGVQSAGVAQTIQGPGAITIIQPGGIVTRSQRVIGDDFAGAAFFKALMHALSFCFGFLALLLLVVACHHWRRWGYLVPALALPSLLTLLIWRIWSFDYPHLSVWALRTVLRQNAVFAAGALTAIVFGRSFARLLIRLLLPPRLAQPLAFLWRTDGKTPPAAVAK